MLSLLFSKLTAQVTRCLHRSDAGTVTAEFAIVFPTVVAVAMLLISLVRVVIVQLDCHDAARQAAYVAIMSDQAGQPISESVIEAEKTVKKLVGNSSSVSMEWSDEEFVVTTSCPVLSAGNYHVPLVMQGQAKGIRYVHSED
ncbi:TadE family protein [Alloscardovia criceti]|uniref:TadE family protein n=1 Tax=Alloscardovia criceti TaxID=356828 RepID=UPI000365121B|nr:TadE family protein [Alloscardovia criceti]